MKRLLLSILNRFRSYMNEPFLEYLQKKESREQTIFQNMMTLQYRRMMKSGTPMPEFGEVGFKAFSETDEDGILHYIFAVIGTTNKMLLDIGAAGIENSNTANMIINHGWKGVLIERNSKAVHSAREFYNSSPTTRNYPPVIVDKWVTPENINSIISENNLKGDIDLLSIDIDSTDYWIWKATDCVRPRVVVVEYQCIWGPDRAVTVPNTKTFKPIFSGQYGIYSGASLSAFVKLGITKGYRLVGCSRYGYNAFFIRNDVGQGFFPEIPAEECFKHPFTHLARNKFLQEIESMEWVEV